MLGRGGGEGAEDCEATHECYAMATKKLEAVSPGFHFFRLVLLFFLLVSLFCCSYFLRLVQVKVRNDNNFIFICLFLFFSSRFLFYFFALFNVECSGT